MTARRLGPGDADLWQSLWHAAQLEAPGAFAAARGGAPMATRLATARPFVWEEDGRALASALWCRDGDPDRPDRGWVEAMYVVPAARGRGLAGRLLDALAADAAACGMAELWLEVGRANTPAWRAYARAGFRPATIPTPDPGPNPAPDPPTDPAKRCDAIALMRRLEPPVPAG